MLECAADTVCLEWQTPAAETALREGADPSRRRLRSVHRPAAPSAQGKGASRMQHPTADDPLADARVGFAPCAMKLPISCSSYHVEPKLRNVHHSPARTGSKPGRALSAE